MKYVVNWSMAELVIVFAIVSAAVVLGARSIYQLVKKDKTGKCWGCASCTCEKENGQDRKKSF